MIGMKNDHYIVYGQPWCGTSKIYTTADHPLGGIVFLKQSDKNHWQSMTSDQKVLQLLYRLISPNWTKDMLHKNMHFSKSSAGKFLFFLWNVLPPKKLAIQQKMHPFLSEKSYQRITDKEPKI